MNHDHYMKQAVALAANNPSAPFATLLVDMDSNQIVAKGLNDTRRNPILHGEIDAILKHEQSQGNWSRIRLYTTAEPCCMCQAAILWAGIPEVVYGTSIQTLRENGWNQFLWSAEDVTQNSFADCKITGAVLEGQCDQLFRNRRS